MDGVGCGGVRISLSLSQPRSHLISISFSRRRPHPVPPPSRPRLPKVNSAHLQEAPDTYPTPSHPSPPPPPSFPFHAIAPVDPSMSATVAACAPTRARIMVWDTFVLPWRKAMRPAARTAAVTPAPERKWETRSRLSHDARAPDRFRAGLSLPRSLAPLALSSPHRRAQRGCASGWRLCRGTGRPRPRGEVEEVPWFFFYYFRSAV